MILEALLSGAYVALTRGLFIVYLSSIQFGVDEIALVIFVASSAALVVSVILYKKFSFVTKRVKLKLSVFHTAERIVWLMMPLATTSLLLTGFFAVYSIFSALISVFLVYVIYQPLSEPDIREITAKRSAASGLSSVIGFALGTFLLAFLPAETRFAYIFFTGALVGLLSSALILMMNLSHLEASSCPITTTQPEKIFSASAFFVILISANNLLGLIWAPFVMNQLNGPAWLAASMSLAATLSSIGASLFWRAKSFKILRLALALNSFAPLLILFTPWPDAHVGINAFTGFAFTGANFVGTILFASYTKWYGAARSSIMLVILGSAAQLVAAPIAALTTGNFTIAILLVLWINVISSITAFFTVPEIAVVPPQAASTYSQILFTTSFLGYRLSIDISKQTIKIILRLLGVTLVIGTLYLIYRVLWALIA
jgi:hypothetical protein